jgi:hypothetical protein
MRSALVGLAFLGLAATSLTGCQTPPAIVALPNPPPVSLLPAPPARPAVRTSVVSTWSFQAGDVCSASARSSSLSLKVSVSSSQLQVVATAAHRVALSVHAAVSVAFTGQSGNWIIPGRLTTRRNIDASSPMTEDAASWVLVLLDGGIIRIGNPRDGLPSLRVPNAGLPGRDWFRCVRQRLLP